MLHGIRTFSHQSTVLRERVCGIAIIKKVRRNSPSHIELEGKTLFAPHFFFAVIFIH